MSAVIAEEEKGPVQIALEKGRYNLLTFGWTQNEYGGFIIGFCAQGALIRDYSIKVDEALVFLNDFADDYLENPYGGIPDFNDDPNRTYEEIIWLFDEAIQAAEEEGV